MTAKKLPVAYDDGAAQSKIIANGKRAIIKALVGINTWEDLGLAEQRTPPIMIEYPVVEGNKAIYVDTPVIYGVGEAMLMSPGVTYDTSSTRYTNESARIRFHAAISQVVPNDVGIIPLTIGCDAERYRDVSFRNALAEFYKGKHQFKANGIPYSFTVTDVKVLPQPWAAFRWIHNSPPANLLARLKTVPMETARTLVIDGGGRTTDFTTLEYLAGRLTPTRMGAFTEGVHSIRDAVAKAVRASTGTRPTLGAVEQAIDPVSPFYGKVAIEGGFANVTAALPGIRAGVWEQLYRQVKAETTGFSMQYLIIVGGLAHICREEIRTTRTASGHLLGDFPGFAIPENPEWTIVEGYTL